MPLSHRLQVTSTSGAVVSTDDSFEGSAVANVSESIDAEQTNKAVVWACDYSALKALLVKVSAACVIKTNSTSDPDDTFTFSAAGSIVWHNKMPAEVVCPLTADVTVLYVTNTPAVTIEIQSIADATP